MLLRNGFDMARSAEVELGLVKEVGGRSRAGVGFGDYSGPAEDGR